MSKLWKIIVVVAALVPAVSFASDPEEAKEGKGELTKEEQRTKNTEYVKHHTNDSHDFGLFTNEETGAHIGFPLPVILWDEGLHVFMSSAFHAHEGEGHGGHGVAESNGKYFVIGHHDGKVYSSDEHGNILEKVTKDKDGNEVVSEIRPIDFSITKNVFVTILMCLFLFWLFRKVAKSYQSGLAPTGVAKFFEPIIIFIRDEIAVPNIGPDYKKYMNYLSLIHI